MTRFNLAVRPKVSPAALARYIKDTGPLLADILRIRRPSSETSWSGSVFKRRGFHAREWLVECHREMASRARCPYPVSGGLGYAPTPDSPMMPLRPDEAGRHADAFADWVCSVWDGIAKTRARDALTREAMVEANVWPGSFAYDAVGRFVEHWLPSVIGIIALLPEDEREGWRTTVSGYTDLFCRAVDGFSDIALRFGEDERDDTDASDLMLAAEQDLLSKGFGAVEALMLIISPMAALSADIASHTLGTPADKRDPAFFLGLRGQTFDAHIRVVWAGLRAVPQLS